MKISVAPSVAILKLSSFHKAQFFIYTPPNGSETIEVSDWRPTFMKVSIPSAWSFEMLAAHVALQILILSGRSYAKLSSFS
jgi:hypothetical protein